MLLFSVFESSVDTEQILRSEAKDMLKTLIENPNQQNLEAIVSNDSYKGLYAEYKMFKGNVKRGQIGKTAQFWVNYTEMAALPLKFFRATEKNDMDLHLEALQDMLPLSFLHMIDIIMQDMPLFISILNSTHPGAEELLLQNGSVFQDQMSLHPEMQ